MSRAISLLRTTPSLSRSSSLFFSFLSQPSFSPDGLLDHLLEELIGAQLIRLASLLLGQRLLETPSGPSLYDQPTHKKHPAGHAAEASRVTR